jgi:hypothetical protein
MARDDPPLTVEDLVQQRIEAARRKIAADKARRREQQQARTRGLGRRHAAKLRHLAQKEPELPTARITDCPRCRTERIARRVGGVHIDGQPHDAWRCTEGRCRLIWLLPAEPTPTGPVRPTVAPAPRSAA